MTEKRFRVQEHCLRSSYGIEAENWLVTNDNHSVVLNNKAEAHMVANMFNDVIDGLNELNNDNEQLRQRNTNQYNQLTELWQIIEEENWEKLIAMKKQLKEDEERLQQEWKCYE